MDLFPKFLVTFVKRTWVTALLLLLMCVNMGYMHYMVFMHNYISCSENGIVRPFFFSLFDVLVIVIIFSIIFWRRKKIAFLVSYIIILLLVIANVIYSRFFDQYVVLDVLFDISNFQGTWWIPYISQSVRFPDCVLLVTTLIAAFCFSRFVRYRDRINPMNLFVTLLLCCFVYLCSFVRKPDFSLFSLEDYKKFELYLDYDSRFHRELTCNQQPLIFRNGFFRTQVIDYILFQKQASKLTDIEVKEIDDFLIENNGKFKNKTIEGGSAPNVIFILVESYLSVSVNMKSANGLEITPNINKLVNSSTTLSNLCVNSNMGGGQSSDAQISYFTGLLPLRNQHGLLCLLKNKCIGLPSILKERKGYNTYMSVPTNISFWHQLEANRKYGIDHTIAYGNDYNEFWCQDEELFQRLIDDIDNLKEPYFHTILTLSMHAPYIKSKFETPFIFPENFSHQFCTYLEMCNYTDSQIGKYLDYLKNNEKLNNTIVVLASDHEVDESFLMMTRDRLNNLYLPIVISMPDISGLELYQGVANQIDLFPTLLELLDVSSKWKGLGHSLLDDQNPGLSAKEREISDKIILGDYFNSTNIDWSENTK